MTEPYFPNQTADMMEFESRLRHAAQMLPVPIRLATYGLLSNLLASLRPTEFSLSDGMTVARQNGGELVFPEYSQRPYKIPKGWSIVFPCAILHAVTPVTSGQRYVFLPFLYDELGARMKDELAKNP